MASRIKHRVEPVLGWLFVAGIVAALAVVLLGGKPTVEVTGQFPAQQKH